MKKIHSGLNRTQNNDSSYRKYSMTIKEFKAQIAIGLLPEIKEWNPFKRWWMLRIYSKTWKDEPFIIPDDIEYTHIYMIWLSKRDRFEYELKHTKSECNFYSIGIILSILWGVLQLWGPLTISVLTIVLSIIVDVRTLSTISLPKPPPKRE